MLDDILETSIFILLIFLSLLFLILLILSLYLILRSSLPEPNGLTYSRNKCKYIFDDTMKKSFDDNKIYKIDDHNKSNLIIPCTYDLIDKEIEQIPVGKNRNVFIINGADEITAKNYLWRNIVEYHGLDKAKTLLPNTFLLTGLQREFDLERMKKECNGKHFILKKNIQRQLGLKITNDISEIENEKNYVLAQELLMNTYLLNKRKINLRVYIVIICYQDKTNIYMFDDGFMYYSKKDFVHNDYSDDNNITTGYVEREVYEQNPLTHTDFKRYLDMNELNYYHQKNQRILSDHERKIKNSGNKLSKVVFDKIEKLMRDVFVCFKGRICKKYNNDKKVNIYDDYSVQVFGADVGISDKLEPVLIEVNKGPDLSPKDEKDGTIKSRLINSVYELIGLRQFGDNGLKLILSM